MRHPRSPAPLNWLFNKQSLAARNIKAFLEGKELRTKHFEELGEAISLGTERAAVLTGGKAFGGALARQARFALYTSRLPTWHHRLRVGASWFFEGTDPTAPFAPWTWNVRLSLEMGHGDSKVKNSSLVFFSLGHCFPRSLLRLDFRMTPVARRAISLGCSSTNFRTAPVAIVTTAILHTPPDPVAPHIEELPAPAPAPALLPPSFVGTVNLIIPVAGVRPEQLLDTFGDARSEGRLHDAIDIAAPAGTPVLAAADGRILKLFQSERGGTTIYQLGPNQELIFYYAHLAGYAPGLAEGNDVRQGDVIAYVGDTGNAGTGNYHLHFSIAVVSDPKALLGRHKHQSISRCCAVDSDTFTRSGSFANRAENLLKPWPIRLERLLLG